MWKYTQAKNWKHEKFAKIEREKEVEEATD